MTNPAFEEWLSTRPPVIQELARRVPPTCYTFNDTGQHGVLHSYNENGTVTVNTLSLGIIPVGVFGVNPDHLTRCGCIETSEENA